jgi:putative membrane protein
MTVRVERLLVRKRFARVDVHRFLPSFILAGYGIFILSLFARNVMSLYINPVYIFPTTLAGAVLVGLAVVGMTRRSEAACTDESCGCDSSCGCEAPPIRFRTYALLAVPLLLAFIFPPRALATFSANERGTQIAGLTTFHGPSTVKRVSISVDTRSFTMQDWVGALSADPNPNDYLGKPVRISGIVVHNSASVPAGYIMVVRYFVTCCIADARPVGLIVRDTSRGALQDNQWVTVNGAMASANYQGQKVAVVQPSSLQQTKSADPYIY